LKGTCKDGQPIDEPLHTIQAGGLHYGEVRAFLIKYYGTEQHGHGLQLPLATVTTKDRFGLVTVEGDDYAIADIGMRMFAPRELFRAQGFPDDYIIDPLVESLEKPGIFKPLSSTAQIRMCGNSVSPPVAEALVLANYVEQRGREVA
jgi:DNA (cytosine-5)-methyltransferase 1